MDWSSLISLVEINITTVRLEHNNFKFKTDLWSYDYGYLSVKRIIRRIFFNPAKRTDVFYVVKNKIYNIISNSLFFLPMVD